MMRFYYIHVCNQLKTTFMPNWHVFGVADSAPLQKQLLNYENKFKKKANNIAKIKTKLKA